MWALRKGLPGCRGRECELLLTAKKLYEASWSSTPKEQQRASEKPGRTIITGAGGRSHVVYHVFVFFSQPSFLPLGFGTTFLLGPGQEVDDDDDDDEGEGQGATKDMGKMLGGEEEKDPDAEKKEEERQEALRQQEEERKAKYAKMEAERENIRQGIRDKYGIKKKEEKEAEAAAAMEQASEGSLTRPKKAVPTGCGDEEEEEESIVDTVMKFLPGPLMDMFNKK
ncbi:complexin-1-like [Centroberyx affinis]|uniref:complexin-1-like n=1 Tax=Centroberyx affinis TaxID=166261 RepID=UPI003A5C19AC